jgi:phospholipase C
VFARTTTFLLCVGIVVFLTGCGGVSSNGSHTAQLTVAVTGTGTVTSAPAGISCPATCAAMYPSGTVVTLTASPGSGYQFSGFGGACTGSTCKVALTGNQAVTATFAVPPDQLAVSVSGPGTVTSNPAGINCPTTCSANFTAGTQVTLTATPAAGAVFSGFGGACSGATCQLTVSSGQAVTASFTGGTQLTATLAGSGKGTVTSSPPGINCPTTCSALFATGSSVTLSAAPASGNNFSGFSGACTGATCQLTLVTAQSVTATFAPQNINAINHIIVILQENRSFDHYFGHLMDYWKAHNYPQATNGTTFDGEPANASNVDPQGNTVTAFNLQSGCNENPSPSWNESHVDRNLTNPVSSNATMDGFVHTAAGDAAGDNFYDVLGHRAMGYFVGDGQLDYYYFMASNFATSDRWFSPAMSRTQINRMYLYGASSYGHAYPLAQNAATLTGTTIFERMQDNNVSWKIYVDPNTIPSVGCTDTSAQCLANYTYLNQWNYISTVVHNYPNQLVPEQQLITDMQNGTLPQVAFLEPAGYLELDEHPGTDDNNPVGNLQNGIQYIEGIINTLMSSVSWKDTVLILTYDEFGGFYDHVPPQPAVPPGDGMNFPDDLISSPPDICLNDTSDQVCGFYYTGYRVPLIVVSPFTIKNYVSHTVMDYTAILKLIETRFNLQPLTARDAAQLDMTEFLDFKNVPWATPPPNIPLQQKTMSCIVQTLSGVTISPSPAPAGGQATVTLSVSANAAALTQPLPVLLSASSPGVVPSSASIAANTTSTSFPITVPTGITSLTVTGTVGGIPVSGTVAVQ